MAKRKMTKEDVADFMGAAAAAKKAGLKTFKFGGKEYPVDIDPEVAKEIELDEGYDPEAYARKDRMRKLENQKESALDAVGKMYGMFGSNATLEACASQVAYNYKDLEMDGDSLAELYRTERLKATTVGDDTQKRIKSGIAWETDDEELDATQMEIDDMELDEAAKQPSRMDRMASFEKLLKKAKTPSAKKKYQDEIDKLKKDPAYKREVGKANVAKNRKIKPRHVKEELNMEMGNLLNRYITATQGTEGAAPEGFSDKESGNAMLLRRMHDVAIFGEKQAYPETYSKVAAKLMAMRDERLKNS